MFFPYTPDEIADAVWDEYEKREEERQFKQRMQEAWDEEEQALDDGLVEELLRDMENDNEV